MNEDSYNFRTAEFVSFSIHCNTLKAQTGASPVHKTDSLGNTCFCLLCYFVVPVAMSLLAMCFGLTSS